MAWKIISGAIASLFIFSSSLAMAAGAGENCGKAWSNLEPTDVIQSGLIYTSKNEAKDHSTLEVKDFTGKLLQKIELPRIATEIIPLEGAQNTVVYAAANGHHYNYNLNTKKEVEIVRKPGDHDSPCLKSAQTSLVTSCNNNDDYVFDLKTQKQISIPNLNAADLSNNLVAYPEKISDKNNFSKVSVYDFATSKKMSFDVPPSESVHILSPHHIQIFPGGEAPPLHLIQADGKWTQYPESPSRSLTGVLPSGELFFATTKNKKGEKTPFSPNVADQFEISTDIYDKTGKNKIKSLDGFYMENPMSGPGLLKLNMRPFQIQTYSVKDAQKMIAGQNVSPKATSTGFQPISRDGKWTTQLDEYKHQTKLVNLETGKTFSLPYSTATQIDVSADGKNIKVATSQKMLIVDAQTGKVREFFAAPEELNFDAQFKNWFRNLGNGTKFAITRMCFPDTVKVIDDDCNCLFKNTDSTNETKKDQLKNIKDVVVKSLCKADFNFAEWEKITPQITKGSISHDQAALYLKRFQKWGGYTPSMHLPILTAILKSDVVEKEPALVNEALKTLVAEYPSVASSAYNILKFDQRMPVKIPADTAASCRSATEQTYVNSMKQTLLDSASVQTPMTVEHWMLLKPFKDELEALPQKSQDAMIDNIAESLSQSASSDRDLKGIFQSKLYYFSKKYALGLFGETAKSTTDLAVAARMGANIPVILGSGKLDKQNANKYEDSITTDGLYGFNYETLAPIAIPAQGKVGKTFSREVAWSHDGKAFSATAKATVLESLGHMVSKDSSPNYAALKKDGKLTGMMIMGSNIIHGHEGVVDQYLTYYQNQGFEFKPAQNIDEVSFFKKSIESGEVDYLIKEAHSDGDENNLFRANKNAKLLEGTLAKKDGTQEVIYLVVPQPSLKDTEAETPLISNQDFGSWIRERPKDQPLMYFNSSCNSTRKVISEITAAHSPNLTPIPSDSAVYVFRDDKNTNGTRQVLQAFREGKNYEQIRTALRQTTNYKTGNDIFIFPDEAAYDSEIRQNLKMNLDIQVQVKDSTGKVMNIDQNVDH